ncbi:hypothetical protein HYH03_000175 [Edaphochlamys debaryana]|uniref:Uncharacterized protein n=1 Tax=Edaphochlamys debaryana TaxID=47281 RepID=A0A836C7E0_9CHLO|nr:hypothetical protein HYH03_000175 [Edaphochlamys debaryana]|eukprot:KAG2501672.1 hypothetical protein HYH03_000175 [Edaphochlamys debaryana]
MSFAGEPERLSGQPPRSLRAVVALAFLSKKMPRVITPAMTALAEAAGLTLVAVDPHRPLEGQAPAAGHDQAAQAEPGQVSAAVGSGPSAGEGPRRETASTGPGLSSGPGPAVPERQEAPRAVPRAPPFDLVLHKLHSDPVWHAHLTAYLQRYPQAQALDPLDAIAATDDRALMLASIPLEGVSLEAGPEQEPESGPGLRKRRRSCDAEEAAAGPGVGCRGEGDAGGGAGAREGVRGGRGERVLLRAPAQAVVGSREELQRLVEAGAQAGSAEGLTSPLLVKTRRVDAAGGSGHGLAVASSWAQLPAAAEALQPRADPGPGPGPSAAGATELCKDQGGGDGSWLPVVVQQYVPHTDALYKVYVLGRHVRVERRGTLTADQLPGMAAPPQQADGAAGGAPGGRTRAEHAPGHGTSGGALVLHGLSAVPLPSAHEPSAAAAASPSGAGGGAGGKGRRCLSDGVLRAVAQELSGRMRLSMFNFDALVPAGAAEAGEERAGEGEEEGERAAREVYVCDVNYFPGYDKMGDWEGMMVEHLAEAAARAAEL